MLDSQRINSNFSPDPPKLESITKNDNIASIVANKKATDKGRSQN